MSCTLKPKPLRLAVLVNGYVSPRSPFVLASYISAINSASCSDSATCPPCAPVAGFTNVETSPCLILSKSCSPILDCKDSPDSIISSSSPPAIDFFDPIVAQLYPDPTEYDLIVLSGGIANPMGSDPWVLKLQDYLKTTIARFPKKKILGICWGQQILTVALGGIVQKMDTYEIEVKKIDLTEEGKKMFPFATESSLQIHQFHRREVSTPAEGFIELADKRQAFVNEASTVMKFQGHPELDDYIAKIMLENIPSCMAAEDSENGAIAKKMEFPHDGLRIWRRILEWLGKE